jgi:ankyrin repeat protein
MGGGELPERLGGERLPGVEALEFSAIVNEKRGQHLPGTREWVFEAVMRWRTDANSAKLFWLMGGGGTGKSVAAAELLARLLDKENAAAWHFCKHTEPARSAPAVLLRSLAGMLCATVEGFEDALKESAGVETGKVDELFEALVAKPLRSVEAPRGADDALVLIIDALDELPRDALKPVLSLLANELKTLPPWIKLVVTSRDEAQIKASLKGYTPSELRVDEARNRQDVRAYLTVLAKEHVELEVTMDSLRHEVEAKFPGLKNLDTFADLEDPLRRSKGAYDEAVRGVAGIHVLEKYKERRLDLIQDETDFEKLYADASLAQTILVDALKTLPGDVSDPGVKGRGSAERKLADKYTDKNGVPHPEKFRDLARATVLFESATDLLKVLTELDGGGLGLEIAQLKNKFASPTPLGYRDMNLNVSVRLEDGRKHLAEVQLNLKSVADAKHIAHEQYEVIRLALPKMCEGTSVGAGALEAYIAGRLRSSALDAAVTSLERKAGGLMLYARLISDQLKATSGKIDFASVGALPAGLDEVYAENFRRVFVDDGAWRDALPLVELICAAAEPLTVDAASGVLGWDGTRCERLCADVSLLFPLREGDLIGVLHKTVTDWLTGEAPFDKRCSADMFFVARDEAHRRLARACGRSNRAGVLDTESYSSDAAADAALASFVEGEGGVASDAYALRWSLFHMKRSGDVSEAVAVACSLSYVRKRSAGDIVSFVMDLNVLRSQDTMLLSDSLVLSRNLLSRGLPLVEQLSQRLTPRANAESSPAARRLADDSKQVASKRSLLAVRSMLTPAGGAERCRIEVPDSVVALATFVDPATGEPRLACASWYEVKIYDPVAGGAALVVIDVGSSVEALAVFKDPATGELRLACGCNDGKVRVFNPVAGGEALLVIKVGDEVKALVVFEDPAMGEPRLACGTGKYDRKTDSYKDGKVCVFDPVAGGEALLVIEVGSSVKALALFADPVTGVPRLACSSEGEGKNTLERRKNSRVVVFDPVAGGEALLLLDIGSTVNALAVFKEPATGAPRLACGCRDEKVRIIDAISGGDALLVLDVGEFVTVLVVFKDLATCALRLACGTGYPYDVRVFDPVAGGGALVVLKGHTYEVRALTTFTDPATGEPRLVSCSSDVRVWNPAASGAAIEAEPEGHSKDVEAVVTFVDPATGALRVVTGSGDGIRVWDAETGGGLLMIDVGSKVFALAFFVDPATGALRLASALGKKVGVFDPVAGGEALLVLDTGSDVLALAFFTDPATGAPRLACGTGYPNKDMRIFDPVAGGEAPVVIDVGEEVWALAVFTDPATGALRLACGCEDGKVRIYDPVAGGETLVVLEGHTDYVQALTVFTDPATGGLRLASGSDDCSVRIWDLAAGGAALFVLEGHTDNVNALTAFADPATGETRLASGSRDKTLRVWDASKGGAALRVVPFEDVVWALTVSSDTSGLFVAFGKRWGELRIQSGTTPLTLACYQGDVAAISDLLQQGTGVDHEDDDGYTPLFVASLKGHVDAARLLLDAGAAIDKRREGVWSPLGIACVRGHLDVATLLVERGAALDLCFDEATPLNAACENGHDAARLLLEKGAEVDRADEDGWTPLLTACHEGRVDEATLLLDNGADVNRAHKCGSTPLYVACEEGHVDAARLLLNNGAEVDRAWDNGATPLYIACWKGHVDAARLLLEKGAEVDRAMNDGRTPLYIACQNGHFDAARLLLDKGAAVDQAAENGSTPLHIACEHGRVDAARLLLEKCAAVDRAMNDGRTPLCIACQNGRIDTALLLLDKGAEVDRADEDGWTPLYIACAEGHVDAARLLLDKGAEVDRAKKDGATPLFIASQQGRVDAARLCLDRGAEVDRAMEDGATPLYVACQNGHVDAARLVLDKGADVNRAKGNGATPLIIACHQGHVGAARLLLNNGAEVDRADEDGWTPLSITKSKGHSSIVALLEEHQK